MKSNKSWIVLVTLSISIASLLVGCSNPDGEGLTDQQKLDGAAKAREQQMAGQKAGQEPGSGAPLTRDSLPGQNGSK
jgi:hypothetical protein